MSHKINETIASEGSYVSPKIGLKSREDHSYSLKQSILDPIDHVEYSPLNEKSKIIIFYFEMLGMFLFTFGAVSVKSEKWADIYIGLSVLMGVIICGPVSGANLNPAVTLCNCLKKEDKLRYGMVPTYYLAQFLGAMIAIAFAVFVNDFKVGPLMPLEETVIGCLQVIASEAFGVFILVFFILQISNPNTTFVDDELTGYMFIVFFVHAGRKYAASSHECINSMIAVTFAVSSALNGNFKGLPFCFLWIAGDFLGTVIAVLFYEKMFCPNVEHMRNLKRTHQNEQIESLIGNHISSEIGLEKERRSRGEIGVSEEIICEE